MASDGYWIAAGSKGGHTRAIHADPDCPRLQVARRPVPAAPEHEEWYDVCGQCDPEADHQRAEQDRSYYEALQEAAEQ